MYVFHKVLKCNEPTFAISNCFRCSANAGGVFSAVNTKHYLLMVDTKTQFNTEK